VQVFNYKKFEVKIKRQRESVYDLIIPMTKLTENGGKKGLAENQSD